MYKTEIDEYFKSGKIFYWPFCNKKEIERICNVQNTEDYLLKMRADEIADNTRLYRVIRKRIHEKGAKWNFTDNFSTKEFTNYLRFVPLKLRKELRGITKGFVFSNEPNGHIIKTDFGKIVIISESLKYFLYFMNLFFLENFSKEIPDDVRFAALRVAIRIMLKKESMDFELDPRGIIPQEIDLQLKMYVREQIEFVIGHEFAHYYLHHLNEKNIIEKSLFSSFKNDENETKSVHLHKFYTNMQKDEFEADLYSLITPAYSKEILTRKVKKAALFFIYLSIYEKIENYFYAKPQVITHPSGDERLEQLLNKTAALTNIDNKEAEYNLKKLKFAKEIIDRDVSLHNDELYGFYGSVYLNSWRGPILKDRIDY